MTRPFIFLASSLLLASSVFAANNFHGLAVSSVKSGATEFTCREASEWEIVVQTAKANGFRSIFFYLECKALEPVSKLAKANGLTILPSIFLDDDQSKWKNSIDNGLQEFISAVSNFGADLYEGIVIGNEPNAETANIVNAVNSARQTLRTAGVQTPVSTTHSWTKIRSDPALCQCTDFIAINAHAYWDGAHTSDQAGSLIYDIVIPEIQKKCPSKPLMITETGWPSAGPPNGASIAQLADQRTAMSSINCAAQKNQAVKAFAFEYDDSKWKKDQPQQQNWGLFGSGKDSSDLWNTCGAAPVDNTSGGTKNPQPPTSPSYGADSKPADTKPIQAQPTGSTPTNITPGSQPVTNGSNNDGQGQSDGAAPADSTSGGTKNPQPPTPPSYGTNSKPADTKLIQAQPTGSTPTNIAPGSQPVANGSNNNGQGQSDGSYSGPTRCRSHARQW